MVVGELEPVVPLDAGEFGIGQAWPDLVLASPGEPPRGVLAQPCPFAADHIGKDSSAWGGVAGVGGALLHGRPFQSVVRSRPECQAAALIALCRDARLLPFACAHVPRALYSELCNPCSTN